MPVKGLEWGKMLPVAAASVGSFHLDEHPSSDLVVLVFEG